MLQTSYTQGMGTPQVPTYDPTAATGTAGSAAPSNTISSAALAPTTPNNFSTPQEPSLFPTASLAANTTAAYSATPTENQAQDYTTQLKGLNDQLAGKATDYNSLATSAGYGYTTDAQGNPVLNDPSINDLSAQLTGLTNEAQAIPLKEQNNVTGRGVTAAGLAPIQTADLRNNAIAALGVSSLIAAKQGKLAYATQLINNAITQKYGPIEAQIKAATSNLNLVLNSPQYTLEQKQQAQQQLDAQNQKAAALDIQKQNYLDAQKEVLKYANVADAQTLQKMQNATSAGEVAQIAAAAGIQAPVSGRYKDIVTTVHNIDGTSYQVTRIMDTTTGQIVNTPPGQSASSLNMQTSGGGSGSTTATARGTTGAAAIDVTTPGYSSAPLSTAGGLTQAAIDQKALSYLTSGTLPPNGRTGLAGLQNAAISNRMAEIDPGGNLAAHKADLKSLSSSLTQQTNYLNTTQRAFNTANDTLTSLQTFMSQNNVNPSQFPSFNAFSNYLKAKGIDPGAAGGYNAQIATLRQEYSQVLAKGGVRSVETDKEAASLIPSNLAPADLARVAAQIKIDSENVINDAQKQVQQVQGQINGIISPAGGSPSKLPQTVQDTIKTSLTFSPDGKTAYIPRAVWSTLGANMDAVLAEAKADGVTLLIK